MLGDFDETWLAYLKYGRGICPKPVLRECEEKASKIRKTNFMRAEFDETWYIRSSLAYLKYGRVYALNQSSGK
ncbi:hypothetical protein AVEN_83803-1, partial [Araneus ventricosus]